MNAFLFSFIAVEFIAAFSGAIIVLSCREFKKQLGLSERNFKCCPVCKSTRLVTGYKLGGIESVNICCKKCGTNMSKEKSSQYNAVQELKSSWNKRVPKGERQLDDITGLKYCPCCDCIVDISDNMYRYQITCQCGLNIKSDESELNNCVSELIKNTWNQE